ncbi:hypothetical protein R5R35_007238 [Gryllus longicercus]|uniref:Accessory gland protein n=1 Tax=Gryllus longicercus TaxID=2509291 RepID=A0AAN9VFV1_9ORTH
MSPRCALLMLVIGAVCVLARGASKNKCPWVMGKYPFDETKMSGEWYIIAGTPLLGPAISKCPKLTFSAKKTNNDLLLNLRLNATNPKDGSEFTYESNSQAFKPEKAAMSQGVWRRVGTEQWTQVYKQVFAQTDYDNYAVFLACRSLYNDATSSFGRHFAAQVWSRRPTLSEETLGVLKNLLTGYDVDPADIQMADQSCY